MKLTIHSAFVTLGAYDAIRRRLGLGKMEFEEAQAVKFYRRQAMKNDKKACDLALGDLTEILSYLDRRQR